MSKIGIKLESDRVQLRRFAAGDLPNMKQLESDPDVVRFTRIRNPLTAEQSRQRLTALLSKEIPMDPLGVWAAEFKDTAQFIGWFMLIPKTQMDAADNVDAVGGPRVELGYMIVKGLWGQGLATEICRLLVEAAFFNLNLDTIEAITDTANTSSGRILEKLNFKIKKRDTVSQSILYEFQNHNWQPVLNGSLLTAEPLKPDHFEVLFSVASDPLIWEVHPNKKRYQREVFRLFFDSGISRRGALLIKDAKTNAVIGSSSFYEYNIYKSNVVIGYTFFARACWGGQYNYELKKLMLTHAFSFVDTVYFDVGDQNWRSQAALAKIGATVFERRDEIGPDSQPMVTIRYQIVKKDFEKNPFWKK